VKKLVLGAVAAAMMAVAGPAAADTVPTPVGTVSVNEGGYKVAVDGTNSNPGPIAGFVSVSDGNQVCADDNGSPDDGNPETGDPATGADSSSPTCTP
jgi:hypothetical protein